LEFGGHNGEPTTTGGIGKRPSVHQLTSSPRILQIRQAASVGFSAGGNPNLLPGDAPSTIAAELLIPHNYILGDSINSSSVFTGKTLSSLGLTHDTHYNWSYGNGDNIVVNVGVIPEPSAFALLGLGTVGLVARRRRTA
jgi:hypothetical protein